MAKSGMMVLCLVVAVCMIEPYAEAMTCGQVATSLAPCINYLTKGAAPLPPACCTGVQGLNKAASSTPDRKTVCSCLKQMYASTPNVNLAKASSLPGQCGVNIPYKISPSTDCSKIQ
ncbi:non-specific lipid-transfer protein-like [Rutidosis leptorrhynchoides]|uniref:non-specific lipid-transfer protein-like n=1 Tax=Rutidosis leptorrhynchoides TaxID=125765 RepID=UPI003A9A6079